MAYRYRLKEKIHTPLKFRHPGSVQHGAPLRHVTTGGISTTPQRRCAVRITRGFVSASNRKWKKWYFNV